MLLSRSARQPSGSQGTWYPPWYGPIGVVSLLGRVVSNSIPKAISLAFIVPLDGDCAPSQEALDLVWVTPDEATSTDFQLEMAGGQGRLVRMALAHCGLLP